MKFIRSLSCWLIGGFFIFASIAHFVSPAVYLPMMPPYPKFLSFLELLGFFT